jgi:hypothetical protein
MESGFDTVKDILDVVIVPVVIFALGAMLPHIIELGKRRRFLALIRREMMEMKPRPLDKEKEGRWHLHLKKKFIHEQIFEKPSENRDFILSLPPDLAYNEAQLWIHYEKAVASKELPDIAEHGASWCDYLRDVCSYFDRKTQGKFHIEIYEPWKRLILDYHPELEISGRLNR